MWGAAHFLFALVRTWSISNRIFLTIVLTYFRHEEALVAEDEELEVHRQSLKLKTQNNHIQDIPVPQFEHFRRKDNKSRSAIKRLSRMGPLHEENHKALCMSQKVIW